jgi:hypothetical protein
MHSPTAGSLALYPVFRLRRDGARVLAALCFLLTAAAGCGDDPDEPGGPGQAGASGKGGGKAGQGGGAGHGGRAGQGSGGSGGGAVGGAAGLGSGGVGAGGGVGGGVVAGAGGSGGRGGSGKGGAGGGGKGGAGGAPVHCSANPCSPSATCTDTATGFSCACNSGYTGDGLTCATCATCGAGQYQSAACTATTNTVCKTCRTCPAGTFLTAACGPTTDTACSACSDGCDACTSATACTTCALGFQPAGAGCVAVPTTCRTLHLSQPTLPDGVYRLDPDGAGPGTPFTAYCDMTTDGGGWMKILQYTNAPYTPTAAAVGTIAAPGVTAMAKLADADVNKLSGLAVQREYRIKGDTSTKKLFVKSTYPWSDPARGHGLIPSGYGFGCEDVTSCAYIAVAAPEGRPTLDSNDWRPSLIADRNNQDRYFTDYSGSTNCYATNSLTQRCYGTGMSLNHALIPNLVIWSRELPFDVESVATYRLDEGTGTAIGDSSGNGRGATALAGSWITVGHTGAAYAGAFKTNAALPVSNAITVSAWVRRDGAGSGSPRIASFMYDELELVDVNHGNALGIYIPGVGLQTSSVTNFGAGFHHVALTVALGTLTLYYDGLPVYTRAETIALSGPMTVGARNDGTEAWVGAIDQVRVFDRALTQSEIARLAAE